MDTKEHLVTNVKEWIKMDNEIKKLKAEIKDKTMKKKVLTTNLVNIMKTNKLDGVDIHGGSLIYKKNTVKKTINKKTLLSSLQKYYKNDPHIAEEISKYIMDSREEQLKETIQLKHEKPEK